MNILSKKEKVTFSELGGGSISQKSNNREKVYL